MTEKQGTLDTAVSRRSFVKGAAGLTFSFTLGVLRSSPNLKAAIGAHAAASHPSSPIV